MKKPPLDCVCVCALLTEEYCKRPWFETAELLLAGGVEMLQLREKDLPDGQLLAALMIEETDTCVWGALGTHIVRVEAESDGSDATAEVVTTPDYACAQWLPAFAHYGGDLPDHAPPLLYTRGTNAGGFGNNKNDVQTEVCLCLW